MPAEAVPLNENEVAELGDEFEKLSKLDQVLLFQRTLWAAATARRFRMAEANPNPMIIGGNDNAGQ